MLHFYLFIFVQIIFESLPISSSGHLFFLEKVFQKFNLALNIPEGLEYFLHLSAILIMLFTFYPRIKNIIFLFFKSIFRGDFNSWKSKLLFIIIKKLIIYGICIDGITTIFYFIFKSALLTPYIKNINTLFIGFIITSILLILSYFKLKKQNKLEVLDLKKSIILGLVQGISLINGISRFGATYSMGVLEGLGSRRAFELSFLIQFPLCIIGFVKGLFEMYKYDALNVILRPEVIFIISISSLLSFYLFKYMYKIAQSKKLGLVGFYFIIPIILIILFFYM